LSYINLNGKILPADNARIPVDNGAFRYGYGIFETMLVRDNAIRLAPYHWERLFAGLKQLYFDIPPFMAPLWLEEQVLDTVKKNRLEKLCRVRLQLFAAGGGLYGLQSTRPGMLIECFPIEQDTTLLNENGLVAGIAGGIAKSIDSLSNLKSCNALIYAIAARQAKENKWNDALICNTAGNIIESTIANIFWIRDEQVFTPPLTDGCVAGIMRRHVMDLVPVTERSLTPQILLEADEVFLTNAIKAIRWVATINDKHYENSSIKRICRKLE